MVNSSRWWLFLTERYRVLRCLSRIDMSYRLLWSYMWKTSPLAPRCLYYSATSSFSLVLLYDRRLLHQMAYSVFRLSKLSYLAGRLLWFRPPYVSIRKVPVDNSLDDTSACFPGFSRSFSSFCSSLSSLLMPCHRRFLKWYPSPDYHMWHCSMYCQSHVFLTSLLTLPQSSSVPRRRCLHRGMTSSGIFLTKIFMKSSL